MTTLALKICFLVMGCRSHKVTHAKWDKARKTWSCPPSKDTWVDEKEAFDPWHHKNFVYCVPKTKLERQGVR